MLRANGRDLLDRSSMRCEVLLSQALEPYVGSRALIKSSYVTAASLAVDSFELPLFFGERFEAGRRLVDKCFCFFFCPKMSTSTAVGYPPTAVGCLSFKCPPIMCPNHEPSTGRPEPFSLFIRKNILFQS